MNKRLAAIWHEFTDGKLYDSVRGTAQKQTEQNLRLILVAVTAVYAFSFAGTFFLDAYELMQVLYAVAIAVCAGFYAALRLSRGKHIIFISYAVMTVFVAYCIYVSAFVWPGSVCVSVLAAVFIFPTLILDKSWRVNGATLIAGFVYTAVVFNFKKANALADELLNVAAFTLFGCIAGTYSRQTRLKHILALERLRMSSEQAQLVLAHSETSMCRYDVADRSVNMTPEVAALFGTAEKVVNVPYSEVELGRIAPETANAYIDFYEAILNGEKEGSVVFLARMAGGMRWLRGKFTSIFNDSGEPVYAVVSFADVTERRQMEMAYEKWQVEEAELRSEHVALFEWNLTRDIPESGEENFITFPNTVASNRFNGRTEAYAQHHVFAEDRQRYVAFLNRERLLGAWQNGIKKFELEYRETKGENDDFRIICARGDAGEHAAKAEFDKRWMRVSAQLVRYPDSGEIKAYLAFRDIDSEKRRALAVEALAREDAVTGLFNRAAFREEAATLFRTSQPGQQHAFVMLDIDGFKKVNDTFGHVEGDKLLAYVAEKMRAMLRQDDIIGRMGGDEFAVCMRFVTGQENTAARVEILCRALSRDMGHGVSVSASIGAAIWPRDGRDFDALYKNADVALYSAKKSGGNRFAFYEKEMDMIGFEGNATPIDET